MLGCWIESIEWLRLKVGQQIKSLLNGVDG